MGQAETVAYVCEFNNGRWRILGMGAWRGEDTRGRVVAFLNEFRSRLCVVRVDSIGVGHNFGLHLRDCRFPVELINVALPCESKAHFGENDPARRFVNLKACFYRALADVLERDQVDGLTDEETIGQLAGIRRELDSQGRIKIESKERARERGVASPDRAEALCWRCASRRKSTNTTRFAIRQAQTSARSAIHLAKTTMMITILRGVVAGMGGSAFNARELRRWF